MRIEWLEDLIALAEADSLTQAAQRRHLTQPAFSRRVQTIETKLGFSALDRSHRPARATSALQRKLPELREMVARLRGLEQSLAGKAAASRIVIAAQHALTVSLIPRTLTRIRTAISPSGLRLRSANQNECYSLLMTRQASLMLSYDTAEVPAAPNEALLERKILRLDRLIPVSAPGLFADDVPRAGEEVPLIAYPPEVFLGVVFATRVQSLLGERFRLSATCETALTPAQAELAIAGWGVAWLPETVVAAARDRGELVDLSATLGYVPLRVALFRIRTPQTRQEAAAWRAICATLGNVASAHV
jgi:DNA-binding transcriptional LysR family regulator